MLVGLYWLSFDTVCAIEKSQDLLKILDVCSRTSLGKVNYPLRIGESLILCRSLCRLCKEETAMVLKMFPVVRRVLVCST